MKARTGFGSLVASEWIKLWSLRSTWWCFAILVVAQAGLAFLFAEAGGFRGGVDQNGQAQPLPQAAVQQIAVQFVTQPDTLSVLVLGVLGALAMSGEYSSGMIRSTFAAAPKRIGALLAKLFTFMVSTALVAIVAVGLASAVTMPVALSANPAFDPSDGTYWGALGYEVLYLVLVGGLAIAFGAIITVPAGAISVVLGILLVLPIIASVLRSSSTTASRARSSSSSRPGSAAR